MGARERGVVARIQPGLPSMAGAAGASRADLHLRRRAGSLALVRKRPSAALVTARFLDGDRLAAERAAGAPRPAIDRDEAPFASALSGGAVGGFPERPRRPRRAGDASRAGSSSPPSSSTSVDLRGGSGDEDDVTLVADIPAVLDAALGRPPTPTAAPNAWGPREVGPGRARAARPSPRAAGAHHWMACGLGALRATRLLIS